MSQFEQIRLIASDMDGTLLNSAHEWSDSFPAELDRLIKNGVLFVAASGRQFYNLQNRFESKQDQIAFAAENGSYVVCKGQELMVEALDAKTVVELIKVARTIPDIYILLCGKRKAYIESTEPELLKNFTQYFDRYEVVDELESAAGEDILKVTICDLNGSEKHSYPFFKEWEDRVLVKVSGEIWLDLSHKRANKGRAIACLQKHLGISSSETMVFGDYLNDLEMMKEACFSYAMANAHPQLKEVALFETDSNDNDGVVKVLKEVNRALESVFSK
ncbi:MAG: HAD family hydrolase [Bacteroidales bacterium]